MIEKFITGNGIVIPAVTKEQMIEVDRVAVEETGPNLFQMMENAGRNLAAFIMRVAKEKALGKSVLIFAGTGGNGGGGICAARHLLNHGYEPLLVLSNESKLQEVPGFQLHVYRAAEGKVIQFNEVDSIKPDIIIDALIGYSLTSAPKGTVPDMIRFINSSKAVTISLDIPTGVLATSGETPGAFVKPDYTLTLALPKTGLYPDKCGEIFLADIGIHKNVYERCSIKYAAPFMDEYIIPVKPFVH